MPFALLKFPVSSIACVLAILMALMGGAAAARVDAQVIRGAVRDDRTLAPIERATVIVTDSSGVTIASATTTVLGEFLVIVRPEIALRVDVRRLGFRPIGTQLKRLSRADTVDLEFLASEVAAVAAAVEVTAAPGLNDQRLTDAQRRGWRVYEPELVIQHRERAQDFHQLLRSVNTAGIVLPRTINECVRSVRTGRCLTYVVDGQILGPQAMILPSDVYFLAILSQSQAFTQYGDRAPDGAIYVITRSRLDRVQPRRPPPPAATAAPRRP